MHLKNKHIKFDPQIQPTVEAAAGFSTGNTEKRKASHNHATFKSYVYCFERSIIRVFFFAIDLGNRTQSLGRRGPKYPH